MCSFKIIIENLSKSFDDMNLFNDVNLSIAQGEIFGVSGKNGSGKTTLLKIIAGLISADSGRVNHLLNGSPLTGIEIFQNCDMISPVINIYEELNCKELGTIILKNNKDKLERYFHLLNIFHIDYTTGKSINCLSSGMKQRVKISLALASDKRVLLLDEPSTNLDNDGKALLYENLEKIKSEKIIIIATNDKHEISLCKRSISLD